MDSVKIFPYCLERSTNIKKDTGVCRRHRNDAQ